MEPKSNETILDLGCGRGELVLASLRAGCSIWALDFSRVAIRFTQDTVTRHAPEAAGRLQLVESDACSAQIPPETFDCVVTTDFVEHVLPERLGLVMDRAYSWLKPGGRFVLHTSPTRGYMYFGQFVARGLELLQLRRPARLETFSRQLEEGGHCNIQSVRSLRRSLLRFDRVQVWAEFSENKGLSKRLLDRLHLTPLLAHHLYAVAWKPS
jgi:2-polyprenyl-3-methyl-5-hydroxy-6-metoxy-1,4-benzoquinol methylase